MQFAVESLTDRAGGVVKSPFLAVALGCLIELGCASSVPSPAPSPTTWTLSGTVTDAVTTQPVAGATLSISSGPDAGKTTLSSASGFYSLTGLATSTEFRVTATFRCAAVELFVALTRDTQADISIRPVGTPLAPFSQTDLRVGAGTQAIVGSGAFVSYSFWLHDPSKAEGKGDLVDSNARFSFQVGAGQVIKGWDQGVPGMRVGGKRRLVIPPDLAYGCTGAGLSLIPPNATLISDITLLGMS